MLESKAHAQKLMAQSRGIMIFIFLYLLLTPNSILPAYAQETYKYDAKGKRNPFIPLLTPEGRLLKLDKEEAKGDLTIEGIIYDKNGRSFAIVNSQVVGVGDLVSGYQVLKIEQDSVAFIKDGELFEAELNKEKNTQP